jgi:hypothetical protein
MTIHVLGYAMRAAGDVVADLAARESDGRVYRLALTVLALAVGVAIAVATYPLADPWLRHLVG